MGYFVGMMQSSEFVKFVFPFRGLLRRPKNGLLVPKGPHWGNDRRFKSFIVVQQANSSL